MSTLREQLARFHGAITGEMPVDRARDLIERGEIDEIERLHVYEHAYTARIANVLVQDYPKLARLVGDAELRSWTASYLRAHPPSSFSLREVGAHLARWLVAHRDALRESAPDDHPAPDRDARREHSRRALLADLARLERARTEVFDGPDATPLMREGVAEMDPAEFPSLVLRLVPSSRVVTTETNADEVWDTIENEPIAPDASRDGNVSPEGHGLVPREGDRPLPRVILVWRRELSVIHRTLDLEEARIVPTMIAGTTFGAACELLDEASAAERAIELLVRWLDAGILQRGQGSYVNK